MCHSKIAPVKETSSEDSVKEFKCDDMNTVVIWTREYERRCRGPERTYPVCIWETEEER